MAFNEVNRHVLAGHGNEAALIYEGDRWNMASEDGRGGPVDSEVVSRRKLMLESAKCALALQALGAKPGDRIALNMPSIPEQIFWTEGANRLGVVYTPVFGGFGDKTLSDRIADAGAKIVVTADGSYRNAQMVPFKPSYTDPALDNFIAVSVAIELLETALGASELNLTQKQRELIKATVVDLLAGEVTVERSDVMRGVGSALASLAEGETEAEPMSARQAAQLRIAIAGALVDSPARVEAVIVVKHTAQPDLPWNSQRDHWSHDLTDAASESLLSAARDAGLAVTDEASLLALPDQEFVRAIWAASKPIAVDAECPNFIIYTSGSTGKPKGVVHVHGGYASGVAATMSAAFGAEPGDVLYVVADPGWITGQSYLIAAALLTRVTTVVTEGSPVFPHAGRFASIIERYGVTIFKAGATFLKSVMQNPENLKDIEGYDLSSLKVATFCAEPVSPVVQAFAMEHVTPRYINSYWATEHGGIVWTHFQGNPDFALEANARTFPLPWIAGDVWVEDADALPNAVAPGKVRPDTDGGVPRRRAADGEKGEIVIARPYPYSTRTIWGNADTFAVETSGPMARLISPWRGDTQRYADTYWKRWRGTWAYTQGDFAVRHSDGSFSLHGRSDDVINVSGHRIGTEEIEGAILRDKALDPASPVGNVIVTGAPHSQKGVTPIAFVTPVEGRRLTQDDQRRLAGLVRTEKGAVAVPSDFIELSQFPKTRSGKYMQRMVRAVVEGGDVGDISTLRNPESLEELERSIDAWRARQNLADNQALFERYRFFTTQYNALGGGKRVATVTVKNPPVNALNERALDELVIVAEHLARKDDVIAVVFTGAGTASFVAGADIRQMLEEVNSAKEAKALPDNAQLAFNTIEAMGKPCIAAIQGVALGGGMEFALACHYRIAEPRARFGQPEINLKLLPGYGGTQRLARLLASRKGETGLRDALDLILGGRSIDAEQALAIGAVDDLASGSQDALSLAHAMVRAYAADPAASALGKAFTERRSQTESWRNPAAIDLDAVLNDAFLQRILRQLEWAGRDKAGERALDAIRTGWNEGMAAGLAREAENFAQAIVDPKGGKTGIQQFMDKQSPPLPVRRDGVWIDAGHETRKQAMIDAGDLLPVGAPFYPGVTPIPPNQIAFGIARDPVTGAPRFGPPATHERELFVKIPVPSANEALIHFLTSEVNFNDIWALTGIPVSPFDAHDEDVRITGSGGLALVVGLGSALKEQGRLQIGDLVSVYSGTSDLLSPAAGDDPMYAGFSIQGYETKTGSHAQFLTVQGPQLHKPPADLTLEQAGAYTLNLGTVARCLFTTLQISPGKTIFVEGSATGTGLDALKSSVRTGLSATGLVSSEDRADFVKSQGAVGAINRKDPELAGCFTCVPDDPQAAIEWEREGEKLVERYRAMNNGKTDGKPLPVPRDIAATCLFLASDEASGITGEEVDVSHGLDVNRHSSSTYLTRPSMRSLDGAGLNVFIAAGEEWDDALESAKILVRSGSRVRLGLARSADLAQANARLGAQNFGEELTVARFNRNEPASMEEELTTFAEEAGGAITGAIVMPLKPAGYFCGPLLGASDDTVSKFIDMELVGSIAVARSLARYWRGHEGLQSAPRCVFMSNPADARGNSFSGLLSAGLTQLIRVWRDEERVQAKNCETHHAVWSNQIIRSTNTESENTQFAAGHATRILFREQRIARPRDRRNARGIRTDRLPDQQRGRRGRGRYGYRHGARRLAFHARCEPYLQLPPYEPCRTADEGTGLGICPKRLVLFRRREISRGGLSQSRRLRPFEGRTAGHARELFTLPRS